MCYQFPNTGILERTMPRRIHKDCPFTEEEILTFKAMLYQVNTSHQCINPAPLCWVSGYQWWQNERQKHEQRHYRDSH